MNSEEEKQKMEKLQDRQQKTNTSLKYFRKLCGYVEKSQTADAASKPSDSDEQTAENKSRASSVPHPEEKDGKYWQMIKDLVSERTDTIKYFQSLNKEQQQPLLDFTERQTESLLKHTREENKEQRELLKTFLENFAHVGKEAEMPTQLESWLIGNVLGKGYLGTDRFFDALFATPQKYKFIGRDSTQNDIDMFVKTGKVKSQKANSNILLIIGEPGSGKTALMKQHLKDKKDKYVHYFIESKARDLSNPKLFLKHMNLFLRNKYHIKDIAKDGEIGEMLDKLTKLLRDITESKLGDSEAEMIFVDGLDNGVKGTVTGGPSIATVVVDLMSASFDDKVRMVVTSRDGEFLNQLKSLSRNNIIVISKDKENEKDIIEFLNTNLKDSIPKATSKKILQKSEGNFLCATLWVSQANKLSTVELERAIEKIPAGLDGIYGSMISTLEENKTSTERVMIRDVMRIIAIAPESLTPNQVLGFCEIDYIDMERVIGPIEQFFDIDEYRSNNLCKYHHSYLEEYVKSKIRDERLYHNKIITHFEGLYEERWEKLDDDYGFNWLSYHYMCAGEYSKIIKLVESGFLRAKLRRKGIHVKLLPDIRMAMQAARHLGDFATVFKYAMLYTDFKIRPIRGLRVYLIPLYARLGKIKNAAEMADAIEVPVERATAYARIASNIVHMRPDVAKDFVDKCLSLIDEFPADDDEKGHVMLTIAREICVVDIKQTKSLLARADESRIEHQEVSISICDRLIRRDPAKCLYFLEWLKHQYPLYMLSVMHELLPQLFHVEPRFAFKVIDRGRRIELPTFYEVALKELQGKPARRIANFTEVFLKSSLAKWKHSESRELFQFLADHLADSMIKGDNLSLFQRFKHPFFREELYSALVKAYTGCNSQNIDSTIKQIRHPYFLLRTLLFLKEVGKREISTATIISCLSRIKERYLKFAAVSLILGTARAEKEQVTDKLFSDVVSYAKKEGLLLQTLAEFADVNISSSMPILERSCEMGLQQEDNARYVTSALRLLTTHILEKGDETWKDRIVHIFDLSKEAVLSQPGVEDSTKDYNIQHLAIQLARLRWDRAWSWIKLIKMTEYKGDLFAAIAQQMKAGHYSLEDWNKLCKEVFTYGTGGIFSQTKILSRFVNGVAGVSPDDALAIIERVKDTELRGELYRTVARVVSKKNITAGLEIAKRDKRSIRWSEPLGSILLPSWLEEAIGLGEYIKQVNNTLERLDASNIEADLKDAIIETIIVEVAKIYDLEEVIKLMRQYLPSEKLFPLESLTCSQILFRISSSKVNKVIRSLVRTDVNLFVKEIRPQQLRLLKGRVAQIMVEEIVELEDNATKELCARVIMLLETKDEESEHWEKRIDEIYIQIIQETLGHWPKQAKKLVFDLSEGDAYFKGLTLLVERSAAEGNMAKTFDYIEKMEISDYHYKKAMEVVINSIPRDKNKLDGLHDFIRKKYQDSEEDRNDLVKALISRYIAVGIEPTKQLIQTLPLYERVMARVDAIKACSKDKQEDIEVLLLANLDDARCSDANPELGEQFQSGMLGYFAELSIDKLEDSSKIRTFILKCLDIAHRIQNFEERQSAIAYIAGKFTRVDLAKSFELLNELGHKQKANVLENIAEVDPKGALRLLNEWLPSGEKWPVILDIPSTRVMDRVIDKGDFSVKELLEIKMRYLAHLFVADPVAKAVEKMNRENRPVEEILELIKEHGTPEVYREVLPKLVTQNSLEDVIAKIRTLKSRTFQFTEELRKDLVTRAIYESAEHHPKAALTKMYLLHKTDQANLCLKIAKSMWSKDRQFALTTLTKSEELAKNCFYMGCETNLADVLELRMESLQTRDELVDIIFVAIELGDTLQQITKSLIPCIARIGKFDTLKKIFDAVKGADCYIRHL